MAKLSELRKQAKGLGIGPGAIRSANTAEELEAIIRAFGADTPENGDAPKPRKKSVVKKAVAKKSTRAISKSASSKSAPAAKKSVSGKAKRPTTAKVQASDGPSGRHMLNGVNFSQTDGWNAREGSPPDQIIRALRRFKGNRAKVFDHLSGDVWNFVGKKLRNGDKRSKASAEQMLRYRISRTAWDFARQTGQHEPSENRVEYGQGGTGEGLWKPAKKSSASKTKTASAKKSTAKKSTARKSTSTSKTAARKSKTAARKRATAKR